MTRLSVFPLLAAALLSGESLPVGLTGNYQLISAVDANPRSSAQLKVILLGGLNGEDASKKFVETTAQRAAGSFHLVALPLANPDKVHLVFPPTGVAYRDNSESHYLWRWIGLQHPDLVLIVGDQDFGLAEALSQNRVAGFGRIPARRIDPDNRAFQTATKEITKSEAHTEAERRQARTPQEVALDLAHYYGHEFDTPVYIPAMALIGRLRLGEIEAVKELTAPYANRTRNSLAQATSSHLAGHLIFAELAERTGDPAYTRLVQDAANLAFTESGEMKEAMPMHSEMSDSVFMGGPILAAAGKLTGQTKYFDMAARHLAFMQKLCLRPDGVYRHSPLNDAAWGRGNAFPALGLALTLSRFRKDHPAYPKLVRDFQNHMAVLAKYQGPDGMWREVIDRPGAYPEFSATAMIMVAMQRGVRNGWLEAKVYEPRIRAAWQGLLLRIGANGELLDVCESTGKQKQADDYLKRAASLELDARGGGMALLAATELDLR
jgi:rhamnogalacturonyl hydrolase YesR